MIFFVETYKRVLQILQIPDKQYDTLFSVVQIFIKESMENYGNVNGKRCMSLQKMLPLNHILFVDIVVSHNGR